MPIPFLQSINLNQNELQNARVQNLAADPSSPVIGQIWFNTTAGVLKYYDGQVRVFAGLQNTLGSFATPTSALNLGGQTIQNLGTPQNPTDAATKGYVDNMALGLDVKASVKVASTVPGTLATSFAAGNILDGIALAAGDRILIKDQANAAENGIYVVAASGAPTRALDCNSSATYITGAFVFVEEGTINQGASFVVNTQGTITPGTTSVNWVQFSGGSASSSANLAGGALGSIPYQSATSTTQFLPGNTTATDEVLVSHGTGSAAQPPTLTNAPALSAANMTNFPTVPNATTAATFTGSLSGDVTGTQGSTTVVKVNGAGVPDNAPLLGTNSGGQLTPVTTIPGSTMPALGGDVTSTAGSTSLTVTKINGTKLADLSTGLVKNTTGTGVPSIATAGVDYVTPSGNITGSAGSFTGNLAGDVSGTQGTTSVDKIKGVALPTIAGQTGLLYDNAGTLSLQASLPTAAVPAFTGDVTNSAGSLATTVKGINGTTLSTLSSGLLFNTTGTGVPSIATGSQIASALGSTAVANATNATSATTATNLGGTTEYAVPYQSGSGTTSYVAPNTTGSTDAVLTSTSVGGAPSAPAFNHAPALSAANMTNFPTLNQNTTGTAAGLSQTLDIAHGGTNATTAAQARANLGAPGKFAETIGDGVSSSIVVAHNLNTTDVTVGVSFTNAPFQVVNCEVQLTSTNTITLLFGAPPASNALRVVVIG